ncbi:replication factor A1 [Methanolinea mesophila]|uniref:nucleotide-binding protein n=1 Tax=Methanolinea mesophila TaxID=547055 RepID=UPI001AE859DB|nr:nucleotide-binding protein [Methanolinea mesophila]MBP1928681.1 replication factor A1 [Methanolinea mesophila]
MDFSETAERISQKFAQKGYEADKSSIEKKLRRLVQEFGVPPAEAERTVTNELSKQFSIPPTSGGGPGAEQEKEINGLSPGEWVTLNGKVVALTRPPSQVIAQTGIFADPTGAIRFVVWAKANATPMEMGKWYRIESAVVDEYKGVANLKIHSGSTVKEIEPGPSFFPQVTPVRDLAPGVGSVRAKVIQEWEVTHERMFQSGLLADESGTIKFVIWREDGVERLEEGKVYNIFYAQVDEYNGRLSLNLNTATCLAEEGDIEVASGDTTATGAFVSLTQGSGLVKRCPVEGCNRVLSRQNYCPVHEIQPDFKYDLRIKGWLDNGEKTWDVLVQKANVETLTGITLDQAVEIAENNPLGMDEVFLRMRDTILGRYLTCRGREIEGRILVSSCSFEHFSPDTLAALLNRAGGES